MRTYAFTFLYLLVLCTSSFGVHNPNSSGVPSFIGYVEDEFVVVLKEEASAIARAGGTPGNALGHIASLEGLRSKFKVDRVKRQFPQAGANAVLSAAQQRLSRHYKVRFRGGALDAVMSAYGKHPLVERVEPIGVHAISIVPPNDKYYDDPPPTFPYDQWHYWDTYGIDAETAWDQTAGDPDVVVAVLDTGVKYYHTDLGGPGGLWDPASPSTAGNIWINAGEIPGNGIDDDGNGYIDDTVGYDFISDASATFTLCVDADCATADNDPDDGQGHGTHVAGTVGAITNNSISVAGIAGGYSDGTAEGTGNGSKVMCLRIGWRAQYLLTGELIGIVRMDYAAEAMNYVATMVEAGTNVVAVNCSWGSSNSGGIDAAVDNLLAHGVMVIHAAGNGNANDPGYLGGKDGVMNVGAT
ncbi:MAG: S8 family serine peptidase, partial [Planctomycetota bacterium]